MRLGFSAGRRARGALRCESTADRPGELAERLQPLVGKWVAIREDDVLHAASTPRELVDWLSRHGQRADSMFRVPEDERAATGLAPL
jgi:hypothetical protein